MKSLIFKKTFFVSLLGHIAVFSIFGLSFGPIIPKSDYPVISFWGSALFGPRISKARPHTAPIEGITKKPSIQSPFASWGIKPAVSLAFNQEKTLFSGSAAQRLSLAKRREPTITLHPLLPNSFGLYFKDRQVAHVELMFNIESQQTGNSIIVKRRISSGNLEVDLLSIRYISRYLFMQQARFAPNTWQVVKIDLSAKDQ